MARMRTVRSPEREIVLMPPPQPAVRPGTENRTVHPSSLSIATVITSPWSAAGLLLASAAARSRSIRTASAKAGIRPRTERRASSPVTELDMMTTNRPCPDAGASRAWCSPCSIPARTLVASMWMFSFLKLPAIRSNAASVVVIVLRPGSGEVSGFFLALCFFGLDVRQLALVENEVHGLVPTQVGMLVEELADLVFEVGGDFNVVLVRHLFLQIVERALELLALVKCHVSVGEQLGAWDDLRETMRPELGLDHLDQRVAGQRVELDARIDQDCDLLIRRAVLAQLRPQLRFVGLGGRGRLAFESVDVVEAQAKADRVHGAAELIPPGVPRQRPEDHEPRDVEVVQGEQGDVRAAYRLDQLPRSGDRHALRRDDHQVVSIGEVHGFEQRVESFLFAKQDRGDVPAWTDGLDVARLQVRLHDLGTAHGTDVVAHPDRPTPDRYVGVRLLEVSAGVVDDVPADTFLRDVIRQQTLREIPVGKMLVVGHGHDLRPRLVVDLPRHGGQSPAVAGSHVRVFHHLPRGLLLLRLRLLGHPRGAVADHAGVALLGFLLPRPLTGRGLDGVDDVVGDVARAL